jgi:hypothetical protein
MVKKIEGDVFSEFFSQNGPKNPLFGTPSSLSLNKKKRTDSLQEFLHPVDETPDFHDPYSNLSLFLSEKIKKEMEEMGPVKKWTLKLQQELIAKITPEFQKKFPSYRLGVSAVKKIWEKVLFYTQQIQGKSGAVDQDGKLNINFFIQENLKQYFQQKARSFLHPYQVAHQIASKMSECIATLEGTKPKLDLLTKTVWSLQKHLLNSPLDALKTPHDEFDKVDNLIVKTILEITARHPYIGLNELEQKTKESLQALHDLPVFSSIDKITCNVSAFLSEKLYSTSPFHMRFFAEQKEALCHFVKKHSALYKDVLAKPSLPDLVRRISALYNLATHLPKDVSKEILEEAIKASVLRSSESPILPQPVYAFISAELCLLKGSNASLGLEEIQSSIFESYQNTFYLPLLKEEEKDFLEIVIWKIMSETEGFLEKLPYRIGQKIEEEIAGIIIENPCKKFAETVHDTVEFFKKAKALTEDKKWDESGKKIHLWCLQSDMLCRSIQINLDNPLANLIKQKWAQGKPHCHFSFVNEICQEFLKKFPATTIYMAQLSSTTWTFYKYMWFTFFSKPEESSYDRFLKWHIQFLKNKEKNIDSQLKQLEEICKKTLPLMPFDAKHAFLILNSEVETLALEI